MTNIQHAPQRCPLPPPSLSPCLPPSPSPHPLQLSYLSNRKIMGQGRRPQKVQSKGERPTRRRQAREREEGKARGRGAGKTLNFYTHSAAVASCRVCRRLPHNYNIKFFIEMLRHFHLRVDPGEACTRSERDSERRAESMPIIVNARTQQTQVRVCASRRVCVLSISHTN